MIAGALSYFGLRGIDGLLSFRRLCLQVFELCVDLISLRSDYQVLLICLRDLGISRGLRLLGVIKPALQISRRRLGRI